MSRLLEMRDYYEQIYHTRKIDLRQARLNEEMSLEFYFLFHPEVYLTKCKLEKEKSQQKR